MNTIKNIYNIFIGKCTNRKVWERKMQTYLAHMFSLNYLTKTLPIPIFNQFVNISTCNEKKSHIPHSYGHLNELFFFNIAKLCIQ